MVNYLLKYKRHTKEKTVNKEIQQEFLPENKAKEVDRIIQKVLKG